MSKGLERANAEKMRSYERSDERSNERSHKRIVLAKGGKTFTDLSHSRGRIGGGAET